MWGATKTATQTYHNILISIHAPRVGCDYLYWASNTPFRRFQSTHPVWGATAELAEVGEHFPRFQSTHPVWGATVCSAITVPLLPNFNPRTPCGVRRLGCARKIYTSHFNPRTPCGVRPLDTVCHRSPPKISIHAPRVGCDCPGHAHCRASPYFNPRTPCGVRPQSFCPSLHSPVFQSTHPVWGATELRVHRAVSGEISIHAPRVGCDILCR